METPRPELSSKTLQVLRGISTATISTLLLKKGLRNIWLRGPSPIRPGSARIAGRAFTMRFIPAREDLSTPQAWSSPRSTRAAVEAMPAGCVAVVDAMGVRDAGIFGDILCARMKQRGVAGLVSDGVIRDLPGVLSTQLPVWVAGTAAPAAIASLTFVNWQEPIACGGVAVFPGDIVVADDDGAVLIPDDYLDEVLSHGPEQEAFEAWVLKRVEQGAELLGLYPPNEHNRALFQREHPSD